ncbi:MAG: hypothetical protein P9L99_21095 [Candidatus Lernaella stagnicola]|nr:hypothetical protein [Candidatus Lernaella stagnicola]
MIWIVSLIGLVAFILGTTMLFFSRSLLPRLQRRDTVIRFEHFGGALLILSMSMFIAGM